MRLDDEQIERYSRQLILAEVGPDGQTRLLAARVAVVGTGVAAERVVAYLAAAGVGWIAADPALHAAVDPAQPDCTVAPLEAAGDGDLDAAVVAAATPHALDATLAEWAHRAPAVFWIVADRAGALPALPDRDAPVPPVAAELAGIRDALLGTVVATEVVKAVLGSGTPLAGGVLAYDPARATVTRVDR